MPQTPEQTAVANHQDSHAVVSAVAGSGKTETMINRIGVLLSRGVDSRRILCLLFNKSARDDFARRLSSRYASSTVPEVFTYHAFGLRLCNAMADAGLIASGELDSSGRVIHALARNAMALTNDANPDDEPLDLGFETVQEFLAVVDLLKNGLYNGSDLPAGVAKLDRRSSHAYKVYEELRTERNVRSFTDLVFDPVQCALVNDRAASFIANRYDHIIVDEFQDVNEAQMVLIRLVAGMRAKVMAVGDEDQCIYTWRGARPDYMTHRFAALFPETKRYSLPHTFRYGQDLADIANSVISNNINRVEKVCTPALPVSTVVALQLHNGSCGPHVTTELQSWTRRGNRLADVAILVREYNNTIPIEIDLQRESIPYRLVGAPSFVERAESLAVRAYAQLAMPGGLKSCPAEMLRPYIGALLSVPSLYLKRDEMEAIVSTAVSNPANLRQIGLNHFKRYSQGKRSFAIDRRLEAVDTWAWCQNAAPSAGAARFLADLYKRLNLFNAIRKQNQRPEVTKEKIRLLHNMILLAESGRHTIQSFVSYLDSIGQKHKDQIEADDSVLLTSVHRSKGLEFPMVILPDLAEGLFPKIPAAEDPIHDIEDERRLFYVAITRAKHRLLMLAPFDAGLVTSAMKKGGSLPPLDQMKASRFLYESRLQP